MCSLPWARILFDELSLSRIVSPSDITDESNEIFRIRLWHCSSKFCSSNMSSGTLFIFLLSNVSTRGKLGPLLKSVHLMFELWKRREKQVESKNVSSFLLFHLLLILFASSLFFLLSIFLKFQSCKMK